MKINFKLLLFALFTITAISFYLAFQDANSNKISLNFLTPFVLFCSDIGSLFATKPHPWIKYYCGATITAGTILLLAPSFKGSRCIIFAILLAIIGQFLLVDRYTTSLLFTKLGLGAADHRTIAIVDTKLGIPAGASLYILATLAFIMGLKKAPKALFSQALTPTPWSFHALDAFIFSGIFLLALILRVYSINLIPGGFEGELSPYSAGATSLRGLFYANRGVNGPWAPLGILYYLPIFLTTSIYAVDLVSLRLSSALVGLATLIPLFLLTYRLGGRFAAHLATAFFAFNCLHIGWSRTDIHPHGVTTWPSLFMCLFLLKAYDTRKPIWALGVAAMMGLSWHQYPSGQSAVIIPLLALGLFFVFNKCKLAVSKLQAFLIFAGVILWLLGLPLSYYSAEGGFTFRNPFTITGPRASWGDPNIPHSTIDSLIHVTTMATIQTWDVIRGIFFKQPYFFHQEWVPYFDLIQARTVAWLEVPFVLFAFFIFLFHRKRFECCVIFAFLLAAILPGVLSEHAYPKRLSTFFPALDILAGIGIVLLLKTVNLSKNWVVCLCSSFIISAFALYFCFLCNVWFSQRYWKMQEPPEIAMTENLAQSIVPGTIVLGDVTRGYDAGKYLYLLLDHLTKPENRPNLWMPSSLTAIQTPLKAPQRFKRTWCYLWTKLDKQIGETESFQGWKKVLFIFQTNRSNIPYHKAIADSTKERCEEPSIRTIPAAGNLESGLLLIECDVDKLRSND